MSTIELLGPTPRDGEGAGKACTRRLMLAIETYLLPDAVRVSIPGPRYPLAALRSLPVLVPVRFPKPGETERSRAKPHGPQTRMDGGFPPDRPYLLVVLG